MGRKGMKSFLKGVSHSQPDADAPQPDATSSGSVGASAVEGKPAKAKAVAPPTKPASSGDKWKTTSNDQSPSDEEAEPASSAGPGSETRGQMQQRHKREMLAHKKAMGKLGKSKKDDITKLTTEITERHESELKSLDEKSTKADEPSEDLTDGIAAMAIKQEPVPKKLTKAQQKKEKLRLKAAERDARIAEEQEAAGPSERQVEEAALVTLLKPHQLQIREIRADGHCLYRAIQDQLQQSAPTGSVPDYLQLRRLAAEHMRSHPDDYLPFLEEGEEEGEAKEPSERLDEYCSELESTACWGGQMELKALAEALKRHIRVFAVGMPEVNMSEEFSTEGSLRLCYLRHAFGLGEHYNSVEPLEEGEGEEERSSEEED